MLLVRRFLWRQLTSVLEAIITFLYADVRFIWLRIEISPNIIQVIKSRRLRWAGHVARVGERRGAYRVFSGETLVKETTWNTQK